MESKIGIIDTTVIINQMVWEVKEAPMSDARLQVDGKLGFIGRTFYEQGLILIQSEIPWERKIAVIRHELAHAWLYETQLSLKEEYNQEEICDFMAMYAEQIVRMAGSIYHRAFHPEEK